MRSLLFVVLLSAGLAAAPAAAQNEAELARLIAAYSQELARVENYLAWYDQLQRMELAQGRSSVAEADGNLRARAGQLYRQSFSDAELAQLIAQHRQAAEGYFAYVGRAVAAAPAEAQAALAKMLEARRKQYADFAGQGLDPLPVLSGTAAVDAAARGHAAAVPAALDPFRGQRERILAALPDPDLPRLAASAAAIAGEVPVATAPPAAPPTGAGQVAILGFSWVGMDADRTAEWSAEAADGRPDGHFRLRLRLDGVQEIRSIAVHTTDDTGALAHGQHWHSATRGNWLLAVAFKDRLLNSKHVDNLGRFRGTFTLDLFAADSGYFKSGQPFVVEVETAAGSLRQPLKLGAPVAQAPPARPTPGEMTAARPEPVAVPPPRPVPGEMGKPASAISPPPPAGSGIQIVHGTYGANCGAPPGNATDHLRQTCDGRTRCEYVIDHRNLGDPAYGCQKDYAAAWDCAGQPGHHVLSAPAEAGYGDRMLVLSCGQSTTAGLQGLTTRSELDLPHSGLTADQCQELCERDRGCVSFSFLKPAGGKASVCLATSRVPEQLAGRP